MWWFVHTIIQDNSASWMYRVIQWLPIHSCEILLFSILPEYINITRNTQLTTDRETMEWYHLWMIQKRNNQIKHWCTLNTANLPTQMTL
jgi:hypothetical protein